MKCFKCSSNRVAQVSAKCSDLFSVTLKGLEHDGYVVDDFGIGGGDYVEIDICLDCGFVQGEWPVPETKLERKANKKKKEKVYPPRDQRYTEWLDMLSKTALADPYGGIDPVVPIIFGEDDPDKVIAGIVELFRHEELYDMAVTAYEKCYGWEYSYKLMDAVSPWYGDDDDDDDKDMY